MRTLTITYDDETESVKAIDGNQFKGMAMVVAVLTLAVEEAKFAQNMARVRQQMLADQQGAQQAAAAQQKAAQIRKIVGREY